MRSARKKTTRQQIWEYMRRNKIFEIGDILLIFEVGDDVLRAYIRQLLGGGYLQCITSKRTFEKKAYRLIKNTGALAPIWIAKEKKLIDANIQSKNVNAVMKLPILVDKPSEMRPVPVKEYNKGRVLRILTNEAMGANALKNSTGLTNGAFYEAIEELLGSGEVVCENAQYKIIKGKNNGE